jgi:tetratricopeptide (TPR) repeat protein
VGLSTSTARLSDIGNFYESAVVKSVNTDGIDKQFLMDEVNSGIALEDRINAKVENDPVNWLKLASLYYIKAYLSGGDPEDEQKAVDALNQVQELAPQRVEPLFLLAKVEIAQGQIPQAESTMRKAFDRLPASTNSNWHTLHKKDALNVYDLLLRHYANKEDYKKVLGMYRIGNKN